MGKKIRREEIELAVMQYLNKTDDWSTHFYDCGQNGILHIRWFHRKWEKRWIETEELPDGYGIEIDVEACEWCGGYDHDPASCKEHR